MKKYLILFLLPFVILSCNSFNDHEDDTNLIFDDFPLAVPEQNSLMAQWEKKTVHQSRLIDDMEQETGWVREGIGEMSYTGERATEGKQSLRFRTSLRDEEYYRQHRSEWGSFNGGQGGNTSIRLNFSEPQDWSGFNRISFWVYVHPTSMPTYGIYLHLECEGAIYNATSPRGSHFVHDLKPGQWNHILFEIPHLKRDKITSFGIFQMLRGHNPEEDGIVTYDIDQLEIQQVDADQYEGWEVAPGKFSFCHAGYRPSDHKIALVGAGAGEKFQLIDSKDKVVFSNDAKTVENSRGIFRALDFSEYRTSGEYRIRCGSLESNPFPINDNIWKEPVFKAINFFFCERCGFSVPGIHLECHKDWQGFYGDKKLIINGGWHDAGDLSQGSWRTSMAAYAMMQNLEELEKGKEDVELAKRIRAEIAWGLEWLLKTRFGDGYHMSFSVMRIYTDNRVGTIDDVVSPAANIPWENFLAAAVECKAAMMLEKSHPQIAQQARIAAIEDWQFAADSCDSRNILNYREAAWGATSSILMKRMTGDEKYSEHSIHFGHELTLCQEQRFIDSIPITGYFYNSTDRKAVIHNHHASFEEAPIIALAMLCEEFPSHDDWMQWYSAAVLHSEFFLKRGSRIASPYNLLPNSVWKKSEILSEKDEQRRADMLRQFNDGTPLKGEYVLRTFPIYRDNLFHGNTNIHMSSTWALAEASRLRHDTEGMQLAGQQFQWVLGANPFGQSLMYGEGYDFAPHFAYCLKNVVGSLPVGMDCWSGDRPNWSASNDATYKEIWVEPVSRFLGAMSIYASHSSSLNAEKEIKDGVQMKAEVINSNEKAISIMVILTGTGIHELDVRTFNLGTNFKAQQVDLSTQKSVTVQIDMVITNQDMPYIAVIMIDKNPDMRREVVGSLLKDSFRADAD